MYSLTVLHATKCIAQSALQHGAVSFIKIPYKRSLIFEKSAQPATTWEKWFTTTKLAILAKENVRVERFLRPRPTTAKFDYPEEPNYQPALHDETSRDTPKRTGTSREK